MPDHSSRRRLTGVGAEACRPGSMSCGVWCAGGEGQRRLLNGGATHRAARVRWADPPYPSKTCRVATYNYKLYIVASRQTEKVWAGENEPIRGGQRPGGAGLRAAWV